MDWEKAVRKNAVRGLQSALETGGALVHLRKEHAEAILDTMIELQGEIVMMKMLYGDPGKIVGELICCGDCKYGGTEMNNGIYYCTFPGHGCIGHTGDWYCADAKRKEENEGEDD